MQMHPIEFPAERRQDPMRRAEARVFDEFRHSLLPGFAYYEWQRNHNSPQLDFALWLPGVGRFGLQIKGGQYRLQKGKWYLMTGNGSTKKDSLVRKTWDASMLLHDDIVNILGHDTFFIAVLVFPDMEPDQAIAANARRSNVHVIWGVDSLVDKLQEIAAETEVYNPPDEEDIEREVTAVTDEQVLYEHPGASEPDRDENPSSLQVPPCSRLEVTAGHVTIQHVDKLIVQAVPGWNLDPAHSPPLSKVEGDETTTGA